MFTKLNDLRDWLSSQPGVKFFDDSAPVFIHFACDHSILSRSMFMNAISQLTKHTIESAGINSGIKEYKIAAIKGKKSK